MRLIEIAWADEYGGRGVIAKSGLYIQYRHEAELKAGITERHF